MIEVERYRRTAVRDRIRKNLGILKKCGVGTAGLLALALAGVGVSGQPAPAPVSAATPVRRTSQLERPAATGFSWQLKADRVSILHSGRALADYVFQDAQILRPHFQNLRAPSGVQVTRTHPPAVDEPADHPTMHPGVWLAFGDISGQDFWRNKARIEHLKFSQEPALKDGSLTFATQNRLVSQDGTTLGTQNSRLALTRAGEHAFLLTWEAEIRGDGRELVFGDQEEMGLGVRVATVLTEKNGGLVVNSDGLRGAKVAWGKRAAWAAYSREVDGRIRGAAIFPATSNPTPTWWHSRDYGAIVANGFGKLVLPASANGKLVVKAGEALKLRYGVLLFDAPAASPVDFAKVNREFQAIAPSQP